MIAMMATTPMVQGPAGRRFGPQLRKLRLAAGLDQSELSEKLTELGHALPISVISRIETGQRRADVSDLMAFAVALNVSPNALLLPGGESDDQEPVELAEDLTVPWQVAWQWATGERWLPEGRDGERLSPKALDGWQMVNAPHRRRPEVSSDELMGLLHLKGFATIVRAVENLQKTVPPELLQRFLTRLSYDISASPGARRTEGGDDGG